MPGVLALRARDPQSAHPMRLTCPACAVTYDVPDARIGAGRRVRCARCQHDWFVEPPSLAATPPESPRPVEDTPFARAV